jgi:tetratricopeptide (TPR) repeat protein
LEPFQTYDFDALDSAIDEAIHWGLLSPLQDNLPDLLTIQPVFPYFLKTKLNSLDAATQTALQTAFQRHYQGLAGYYKQLMDSKDPRERQRGIQFCQGEYENLFHALEICLQKQESIYIFFCLDKYFELISNKQSNLKLSIFVCEQLESYPSTFLTSSEGYQIPLAVDRLACMDLETQQYKASREAYQRTLKLYNQIGEEERQKQLWKAVTYHQLGTIDLKLRDYEQDRANYQQVLEIYIEYGDRYSQPGMYARLGLLAEELEDLPEAQANLLQALRIFAEFNIRSAR